MKLDALIPNSNTFNSGYIFFDSAKKMNRWKEVLINNRVQFTNYILKHDGETIFGFKMFRMKKQFFRLCVELEEVVK